MGCLTGLLVFCLLGGNILLFSGELAGDLEDNPIAWIMVIAAVIMDIYFIYVMAQAVADEKKRNREIQEAHRLAELKQKEARILSLIDKFHSEYSLEEYRFTQRYLTPMQRGVVPGGLVIPNKNRDVSACFDQYYEEIMRIDTQIYKLQSKTKGLMSCPGCSSNEEKLSYLQSKLPELNELRDHAQKLNSEGQRKIIHITNFDPAPLTKLRNAILALENSKKCISISGSSPKEFFVSSEPKEHAYFHASIAPVVLNFGKLKAYCYPKIILLFEGDYFIAATNPDGLKITVSQKEVRARFNSDRKEYNDNNVLSDDSFVVQKGYERTTWLHSCKDGSPDLRYSYNPAMHFRDDVVRHGVVLFAIGEYKAEFAFSSHQAYEALVLAQRTYCTNNSAVIDPIPVLLDLFDALGTNNNLVREMRNQQTLQNEKLLPVCRIIESLGN